MQIEWRLSESGVKCAVTPRKDAVIPGFDQISADILIVSWETPFDEVLDIFYPFLEVMQGILHCQVRRRAHWWLQWKWRIFCSSVMGWWYFSIVSCNCDEGAWLFLFPGTVSSLAFSALSQSSNSSLCLFCNSYLQLTNLVVCTLVVQYQTQNFRQKIVAKEMLGWRRSETVAKYWKESLLLT